MKAFPAPIQYLLEEFAKLPGIGPKSAERFVFYLLKRPPEEIERFAATLLRITNAVRQCSVCFDFSESDPCQYCQEKRRDAATICVVAESADVLAIEKTGEYHGRYHVLGGVLRPTDGITPDRLRISELIKRVRSDGIREVILATNPDLEGEATALYINKLLRPFNVNVTRIAKGLPMGSDLEYADEITLANALAGRRAVNGNAQNSRQGAGT